VARIASFIVAFSCSAGLAFASVWIDVDRAEFPVSFRHFVGQYAGSVNGKNVSLVATDDRDLGAAQRLWEATVTPLGSGDLRNARYGTLRNASKLYREAAWLSLQFPLAPEAARDIQTSIWQLFDPFAFKPSSGYWLEQAERNYKNVDLANFSIVTSAGPPTSTYRIEEFVAIKNTGGNSTGFCSYCGHGGGGGAFIGGGGGGTTTGSNGTPSVNSNPNTPGSSGTPPGSGPSVGDSPSGMPPSNPGPPGNNPPSGNNPASNPPSSTTPPSNPFGGPSNPNGGSPNPGPFTSGPTFPPTGPPGGPFDTNPPGINPPGSNPPWSDPFGPNPPGFNPPPFGPTGGPGNPPYIDPSVFDQPSGGNPPITDTPIASTPEPESLILFGTALLFIAMVVRRSQKRGKQVSKR
jgi:hypothetical protein